MLLGQSLARVSSSCESLGQVRGLSKDLNDEIILENLKEEVRLSTTNEIFDHWQQSLEKGSDSELENDKYPKVSGSFDTGWNQ